MGVVHGSLTRGEQDKKLRQADPRRSFCQMDQERLTPGTEATSSPEKSHQARSH